MEGGGRSPMCVRVGSSSSLKVARPASAVSTILFPPPWSRALLLTTGGIAGVPYAVGVHPAKWFRNHGLRNS
eukprot:9110882-Pyramimonas_sp.AAC.1